jgi:short-subunit dehydrogenase involved in D-alanine esterification of teichoic acids
MAAMTLQGKTALITAGSSGIGLKQRSDRPLKKRWNEI